MKQTVYNHKLSGAKGFLVVLGLVLGLIALNYLCTGPVAMLAGMKAAAVIFWGMGILIALWVYQTFVMAYKYELTGEVLRLNRAYGKRERHIEDIYLRQLIFLGTIEEAKAKNPAVKKLRAWHRGCKIDKVALVYQSSDGKHMAIIQPNEEILQALKKRMKEN